MIGALHGGARGKETASGTDLIRLFEFGRQDENTAECEINIENDASYTGTESSFLRNLRYAYSGPSKNRYPART